MHSPRPAPAPRTGRPPCGRTGLDPDNRVDHLDRFHQHALDRGKQQLVQLRQHCVHGEGRAPICGDLPAAPPIRASSSHTSSLPRRIRGCSIVALRHPWPGLKILWDRLARCPYPFVWQALAANLHTAPDTLLEVSPAVRRSRPWATRSCRDCLGWGWIDRPRCKALLSSGWWWAVTGPPRAAVVARGCPGTSAELCLSEKRRCDGRPSR